jgi:hypothetical protein
VNFAKQHNLGIIMEELKGIRGPIRYGRMLNRRLPPGTSESYSST